MAKRSFWDAVITGHKYWAQKSLASLKVRLFMVCGFVLAGVIT
jgi:hypothetical protein